MIISTFLPLGSGYMRGGLGAGMFCLCGQFSPLCSFHGPLVAQHRGHSSLWEAWHQAHALVTEASCAEEGSGGAGEPCENWIYRGDGGLFPC